MTSQPPRGGEAKSVIELPAPRLRGEVSLESALATRRSIRDYGDAPLSPEDVSQLLWAAQGVTAPDGGRTAPSAGALYPLEIFLVAGNVASLDAGVYQYQPPGHTIVRLSAGDRRGPLAGAALGQECLREAAAVIVFSAVFERTKEKYGERTTRYVHLEAGHAAQNVCLQATALGLGAVPVGAFDAAAVHRALDLPAEVRVVYLIPVGKRE